MKKLISNTEFGKLYKEKLFNDGMTFQWYFEQRNKYDEFLSKSLEKGDFIPCDENGNVLEEPKCNKECDSCDCMYEFNLFQDAKSKVIFEGFEESKKNKMIISKDFGLDLEDLYLMTIEDLIPYNLTLTDNVKI